MRLTGTLEQVETHVARTFAAADAATSDTVVFVDRVEPLFTEAGTVTVDIGGNQYTATPTPDDAAPFITVSPALVADVDDLDPVTAVPLTEVKWATVSLPGDDDQGEPTEYRIPLNMVALAQFTDGPKNGDERVAVEVETEPEPVVVNLPQGPTTHDASTTPIVVMDQNGESVVYGGDGITAYTDDQQVVWVATRTFEDSAGNSVAAADDPEGLLEGVIYALRANDNIHRFDIATGTESTLGSAFPLDVSGVGCVRIAATRDWLYITDSAQDIRRYSTLDGTQDGSPWKAGTFTGLAADDDAVYAPDASGNIRKYDAATGTESGSPWKTGTFGRIATDGAGNVFALHSASSSIRKFDSAGTEDTTGDWPLPYGTTLAIAATTEWFYTTSDDGIDQFAIADATPGQFDEPNGQYPGLAAHAGYVAAVAYGKVLTCWSIPGSKTVSWRLSAANGQVYAPPFANTPVLYSTRWSRTTNQAAGTSGTAVTVSYPDGSTGSSGAGPFWTQSGGVITIGEAGLYDVTGFVEWAANPTGYRRIRINVNGTFVTGDARPAVTNASEVTRQSALDTLVLDEGDTVNMQATQLSGGSLNISAAHLTITRRGALAA